MLDASIAWAVATRPPTLAILLVTVVLAWSQGRRGGTLGVLFVLAVGTVVAATATGFLPVYSDDGLRHYMSGFAHPARLVRGFASTPEKVANIALFVPVGLLGTLLWRRPVVVFLGCVAFTFVIEAWQGFIGRSPDAADVVHNSAGALLGVLAAISASSPADGDRRESRGRG